MKNFRHENMETDENINMQCNCDRRSPQPPCVVEKEIEACVGGIDSSLLFFFLILVAIVCQSDCDISMDTLLWFFLLLVVICKRCW